MMNKEFKKKKKKKKDNTSETNVTTKGTRQKLQRKTSASHSKQEITQCHQCDKKANDYMILCNSCHTWIH